MEKLNFKTYTIDKSFEIKGYFSDICEELESDKSISGILSYKHDQIVLELFGSLGSLEDGLLGLVNAPEIIYGYSSDGKLLILNCYGYVFGTDHYPGFSLSKFHIKNFKIYDVYYDQLQQKIPDIINFLSDDPVIYYDFSFENIEQWVDKAIFRAGEINGELTIATNVTNYQPTKVYITNRELYLEDHAIASANDDYLNLSSKYYLRLSNQNNELEFSPCHETACQILKYIEVVSESPISFTEISFLSKYKNVDDGKRLPLIRGKYFFQHSREGKNWSKFEHKEITLNALHERFERILGHWFSKSEKLDFIINQYTKSLHSVPYIEDNLLSTIRNLEVYARSFHEKKIRKYERENKIFKKSNKESFLKSKLKFLFENSDSGFESLILESFNNSSHFIDSIVQTRNYYTHGDKKTKYPRLMTDYNDLYKANMILQKLLHYYLFKELEIEYSFNKY